MICLYLFIIFFNANKCYLYAHTDTDTHVVIHTYMHTYTYACGEVCVLTREFATPRTCAFLWIPFSQFSRPTFSRHASPFDIVFLKRPLHDVHYIYWRWPVVSGIFAASGKTYKKSVYIHMYVNMCIYLDICKYVRICMYGYAYPPAFMVHTYVQIHICIFSFIWIFTMDNGSIAPIIEKPSSAQCKIAF